MKRLFKILLALFFVLVVLAVAAALVLPGFLEVDRYRTALEEMATAKLGRDVELGALSLTLFPTASVRVEGITIEGSEEEGGRLLEASEIRAGLGLAALLTKTVDIRSITVVEPRVTVLRGPDGRWNLQDLVPGADGTVAEGAGEEGLSVRIAHLAIRSGSISLKDAHTAAGRVLDAQLDDLDLDLRGLDGDGPWRVDVSAAMPGGGRFAWKGSLDAREGKILPSGKGRLFLEEVGLDPLAPWLEAVMPQAPGGNISADLDITPSGGGGTRLAGRVQAAAFRMPGRVEGPVDLEMSGQASIEGGEIEASFDSIVLRAGGAALTGSGEWKGGLEGGAGRIRLDRTELDPDRLRGLATAAGVDLALGEMVDGPFAVAAEAEIRVEPGKARRTTLVVKEVRLEDVSAAIQLDKGGTVTLPGMKRRAKGAGRSGTFEARFEKISLVDSALRLTDRSVTPHVTWRLTDLRADLNPRGAGGRAVADVHASLAGGGSISLEGSLGALGETSIPVDVKVDATIPIDLLAPYLGEGAPLSGGMAVLELERARGDLRKEIEIAGRLAFRKVQARPKGAAKAVPLDLDAEFRGRLIGGTNGLQMERVSLRLPEASLVMAGGFRKETKGTSFDFRLLEPASLTGASVDSLASLAGVDLPLRLETGEPMRLEGAIRREAGGETRLEGDLGIRSTEIHLDRMGAPLVVEEARVRATGKTADIDLKGARIGKSDVRGRFRVEDFDRPRVEFDVVSTEADLAELLAFREDGAEPGATRAAQAGESGDIVDRLTARGTLKIGQGTYGTLSFRDFSTTMIMEGRSIRFDPIFLALYDGKAQGQARFDTSGEQPAYDFQGKLEGVDVNALLSANTTFRDGLFGKATGRFDLRGTGTGQSRVIRNLTGNGDLEVLDGRVAKLDVFQKLSGITGLFGEQSLQRLSRKLAREGTAFSELGGSYHLRDGILRTSDLRLVTPEAAILPRGTMSLLDGGLDMEADVVFSEAMSVQMQEEGSMAADLFWDTRKRRVVFPAEIGGRVADPKVTPRGGSILEMYARREAEKKIDDFMGGVLGRNEEKPPDPSEKKEVVRSDAPRTPAPTNAPGLRVRVGEHYLSGNFLSPDLKIEGWLEGRDLESADLEVRDERGRVILEEKDSFPEIAAWYKANPGKREASVPFKRKIRNSTLGGSSEWKVSITVRDRQGRTSSASFTEERGLKQLF